MSPPFWLPVKQLGGGPGSTAVLERRGPVLYRLWARCDLCGEPQPYEHFTVLEKGENQGFVCDGGLCWGAQDIRELLEADGWREQGEYSGPKTHGAPRCTCDEGRGCAVHLEPRPF